MFPKQELSQEQIEEIRALRDQLPAAEAKKRFGIGSSRLYDMARGVSTTAHQPPSAGEPQCTQPRPTEALQCNNNKPRARPSKTSTKVWRGSSPKQRTLRGGAGPAGSQRRPRRLSRQAGGRSLGPSAATRGGGPPRANRGRDGPPHS